VPEKASSEKASSEKASSEKAASENESEPETPLFEQEDIVVPEGSKRKRNSAVRLADVISNDEKAKQILKLSQPKEELGKGSHLYNMATVKKAVIALEKDKKHDDIKTLYKFCTGTGTVKAQEVRMKLLRFKGLAFTIEDAQKVEKHEEILGVYPMASLKWCMKIFGILPPPGSSKQVEVTDKESGEKKMVSKHISPDKDVLIATCMEWLFCPKAQKPVKAKVVKKVVKKKVVKEKLPVKPKQSEKRKNTDKTKTASPTKKQKPDKTSQLYDDNDSTDDDKPLKPTEPKEKKKPGKKELRRCINKLLKTANLEVDTMKVICGRVYDAFPEHTEHVMSKKSDIKALIKEYISNQ